jgi:hypothetical protein
MLKAPIWYRPYGTVTHPPRYTTQCWGIIQSQVPYAIQVHICRCEWVPWCVQCWLLSSRNFVVHFDCHHHIAPARWKCMAPFGNLLPLHHIVAIHLQELLRVISLPTCLVSWTSKWGQFSVEGHHVEMWQLCPVCTYALNHMTPNTRALCHIYEQYLKFHQVQHCVNFIVLPPKKYLYLECRYDFSVVVLGVWLLYSALESYQIM